MSEGSGRPAEVVVRRGTPDDDGGLRRLLRDNPTGVRMRLTIEKEPSFFDALEVEGERAAAILATAEGRVVGVGCIGDKPCFVDGAPEPRRVGYLSNARIEPGYRGGPLLVKAYGQMEALWADRPAGLFLTTILEDNRLARHALASGRPGLPTYNDHGRYDTLVLATRRNPWRRGAAAGGVGVRRATRAHAPALAAFWRSEGPRRQFFPAYTADHLAAPGGLLRGLSPEDVRVAEDGAGAIVGTVALWDQRPFRQWVVKGYDRRLGLLRPVVNAAARVTGRPELPPPGATAPYRFLACVCVRDDDEAVLRALLASVWDDVAREEPGCMVVAGAHEGDPLHPVLASAPHVAFRARLYVVCWDKGRAEHAALGDRVPYVEVGSL